MKTNLRKFKIFKIQIINASKLPYVKDIWKLHQPNPKALCNAEDPKRKSQ